MTILIAILVLSFACVKLQHVFKRYNPNMSSYNKKLESGEKISLGGNGPRVAFSIEDYYTPIELKDDPRYVKWMFRVFKKIENKMNVEILPFHKCKEEDFA